jgi:malate dehydrogenase
MTKISIIGAGNLGSFIAYEIASRSLANEIVLVDIIKDLAEGQAADIQQALPFKNNVKVHFGEYNQIKNSAIIVLVAGKPRTLEMQDRLQLAEINIKIMGSILEQIKEHSPNSILITVANPVDILNHFIYKFGFAREKVIGSGGQLDSSRFRICLGFPGKEVEAFILGEHGNDQIPIFSGVLVNGIKKRFSEDEKEKILQDLKQCSIEVITKKGATIFAPASNTADMVEAIIKDQKKLMACSVNLVGEYSLNDVSLGVPVILGKNGVEEIKEWELNEEELSKLKKTGKKLKEFYLQLQN